jgi:hypothetical protein
MYSKCLNLLVENWQIVSNLKIKSFIFLNEIENIIMDTLPIGPRIGYHTILKYNRNNSSIKNYALF